MSRKPLDPNPWTIKELFDNQMYTVPVYQRPYSWEKEQVQVFLDDIKNTYLLPQQEKEEGYFIGSIYIYDTEEKVSGRISKYEIIDGQQRITTIVLMLLSIYSRLQQKNDNNIGIDQTFISIKSCLWKFIDRNYDKKK